MLLWQPVMAPPLSGGIWRVNMDAVAGMVIHHTGPPMEMPEKISKGATANILEIGAPSDHQKVKKCVSPRH